MSGFFESTVGVFVGIALVIFSILGGLALAFLAAGDSWAEMCTAQGGEFVHEQVQFPDNPDLWSDNERCELP